MMGLLSRMEFISISLHMTRFERQHTILFLNTIKSRYVLQVSSMSTCSSSCVLSPNIHLTAYCPSLQFHYNLGKILSTAFSDSGKDDGEISLLIASQMNHGKESFKKDNLCMPAAKLNMKAGKKALDGGHFQTAYSYLDIAQSLLPDDNWESCYELSLQLNFLLARAANSSCKYDVAKLILQTIGEKARCFEDKLPSYYLLVTSKFDLHFFAVHGSGLFD